MWEALQRSSLKEPYYIRRLLTEGAVRASDKRAQFVGVDAYQTAGGGIMRDLFDEDNAGWLQDPVLLDRLMAEKLERDADAVQAEGWKWAEIAIDFPYGHTHGLRRISGEPVPMSKEEAATAEALRAEYEQLEQTHADANELPEDVDQRLGEIETALSALEERPVNFDPEEVARAGAFISIDGSGGLRVERGYVRPEDEAPGARDDLETAIESDGAEGASGERLQATLSSSVETQKLEDDEGLKPIPDRLLTELTAYRTFALRDALAQDPDMALLATLHALCLTLFYECTSDSCLEIGVRHVVFGSQAPGRTTPRSRGRSTSRRCPISYPATPPSSGTRCLPSMPTAATRCLRTASR